MCKKSVKNSQPFVKKMKNVRTPQGGFFFTHTVHVGAAELETETLQKHRRDLERLGRTVKLMQSKADFYN